MALTCLAAAAQAAPFGATIYVGHDSSFGSSANNPSSFQGYTDLQTRWSSAGANVSITSTFSTAGQDLFLLSNPTSALSGAQIAELQSFLGGGGLLILTHDGSVGQLDNVASALGSSLSFGAIQGGGTVTGTVVNDTHPFMAGLSVGDPFNAYSPGQITGGTSLVDYNGKSIIAYENYLGGTVLGVADFDILNNVPRSLFSTKAAIYQFQDNLIGSRTAAVPLPAALPMLGIGLGVIGAVGRRRRRRA